MTGAEEKNLVRNVEGLLASNRLRRRIFDAKLDLAEKVILDKRLGLDGEMPRTWQEIGEDLGKTIAEVQEVERKALAKLGLQIDV